MQWPPPPAVTRHSLFASIFFIVNNLAFLLETGGQQPDAWREKPAWLTLWSLPRTRPRPAPAQSCWALVPAGPSQSWVLSASRRTLGPVAGGPRDARANISSQTCGRDGRCLYMWTHRILRPELNGFLRAEAVMPATCSRTQPSLDPRSDSPASLVSEPAAWGSPCQASRRALLRAAQGARGATLPPTQAQHPDHRHAWPAPQRKPAGALSPAADPARVTGLPGAPRAGCVDPTLTPLFKQSLSQRRQHKVG